jgi:acetoin utilization protein AcuC
LKVAIVYHDKYSQLDLGAGHPFRGDRFVNAMHFFKEKGLLKLPNVILQEPQPATKQDLLRVHSSTYVDLITHLAEENMPYDIETPVSLQIYEAAMLIIGGAITAGEAIYKGTVNRAIALGGGYHHAGKDYGGGFCLFNDIAILTEFLREKYHVQRVLNLDYDVHYGNGTSDIFYSDPSFLYVSIHQDPRTIYPRTGFIDQIGSGPGEGFNVNVPLPPGTSDQTYLYAVNEIFTPLAEEFGPDIILANGGSDAHFADTLGRLQLTSQGFFQLSRMIAKVSDRVCNGKLILMVGSGYNPVVLPICWYALATGVVDLKTMDVREPTEPSLEPNSNRQIVEETLANLKQILKRYWKCFR